MPSKVPMITVVLARPEIPANVGFIARNMACHGLVDLRITGRPGIAANPEAIRTASGEDAILASARDFADLKTALSDCTAALAFSRRVRDPGQRILDLSEAVEQFGGSANPGSTGGPLALVFGRESQGLSREETFACSQVVRIPLPGPMQSLNLSHAVAITLYAFFGGNPAWQDPGGEKRESGMRGAAGSSPRTADRLAVSMSGGPLEGRVPAADPASSHPFLAVSTVSATPATPATPTTPSAQATPATSATPAAPVTPAAATPAPGAEVLSLAESERILKGVINRLQERGLLNPVKAGAHEEYLRILWQRLQPTRREFEFLVGLLKKLAT